MGGEQRRELPEGEPTPALPVAGADDPDQRRGRFGRWLAERRRRADEAHARREATRVRQCAAPRCWARTVPGGEYCGLHQQL